jgi:hypothetical protein
MGLYKGKVQSIFTCPYILPSADEKRKEKRKKREVIYQEAQSTSSWTRGLKS